MKTLFFSLVFISMLPAAQAQFARTEELIVEPEEVIHITSSVLDKKAHESISHMYISNDEVLMESEEEKENATATLFDADKDILYIINHDKKEYMALDKERMQKIGTAVSAQMKQLEAQLEMLPEEQRAMVKKQMKGMTEELSYTKVASDVPVNDWRSTQYVGKTADGKARMEIYLADFSQLGIDSDNVEGVQKMVKFIRSGMTEIDKIMGGSLNFNIFSNDLPIFTEGVPVRLIYLDDAGNPVYTNTVTAVEDEIIEEEKFKLPEGYKEQELQGF